jgi:hypothetical protein
MGDKLKPETIEIIAELFEEWLYQHSYYKASIPRQRQHFTMVSEAQKDFLNTRKGEEMKNVE